MSKRFLIRNKGTIAKRSISLRMIELGFLITVFELAATLLPELRERVPFNPAWLLCGAAVFQFLAWIGRFVLQPKLEARANAEDKS
jgi:hypothetical protein